MLMRYPVRTRVTARKGLEAWTMTNDATRIPSAGSKVGDSRQATAV